MKEEDWGEEREEELGRSKSRCDVANEGGRGAAVGISLSTIDNAAIDICVVSGVGLGGRGILNTSSPFAGIGFVVMVVLLRCSTSSNISPSPPRSMNPLNHSLLLWQAVEQKGSLLFLLPTSYSELPFNLNFSVPVEAGE